jgi:hypothetical protein
MTNIFKTPEKRARKNELFQIGIETLHKEGWTVTKAKLGKSSVRRIERGGESKLVSIRTTQDQWIAFPPKTKGKGWITLDDVDVVLAVSVDANEPPREALVHWLPGDEMRQRFDLALKARKEDGRVQPDRRGVWIPLYEREDASENVSYVGGGAGLDHPPIARVPMSGSSVNARTMPNGEGSTPPSIGSDDRADDDGREDVIGLTIGQAKRGLSLSLGVPESSITIMVEA